MSKIIHSITKWRDNKSIFARLSIYLTAVFVIWLTTSVEVQAQSRSQGSSDKSKIQTIAEKTVKMQKIDGFLPLYWDKSDGKLWMQISSFNTEALYINGLAAGLGSNDIGLDRAQVGGGRIIKFERVGPKILMVQPNYRFRATTDNSDEVRAVKDAFAESILWGFTVAAETNGNVLVDITDFLIRDSQNYARRLQPGTYKLDKSRSAIYIPMTLGFPKNTEAEATLTYVRTAGGSSRRFGGGSTSFEGVGNVAASSEAVTLRAHYSFVELPDANYKTRKPDPRAGYGFISYRDYSAPLGESMIKKFIRRHRLKKKNPAANVSEAVKPIVYYLDRGTPEPIRSALLEGAGWWNQAFEAAGYKDAFRVEVLPEGASNMDIRYNMINWVHRSTRGWSYGGSVTDPRTGEILKGVVALGSLRIRQDYMIAEGLLSPYENGTENPPELAEWALARIRQLSAHEVGHTIGLGHNYYDSKHGRISVMDYPHPLITLKKDGTFDCSKVYDVGIGEWDKVTIAYGYQDFPEGTNGTDEDAALTAILDKAWEDDIRYLTNQDISANPKADQWSNGNEPAVELKRMMKVRRAALDRFGEKAIKKGMPMATMEEVLVPLFMHHRYQVEAAASALGGMHYIYAMRGDGREPVKPVPANEQWAALDALLETVKPSELAIPRVVLNNLPPRPSGFRRTRELFPRYTGLMFDAVSPATVAADLTFSNILRADRTARLVEQHALDSSLPGLKEILNHIEKDTFGNRPADEYEAEISRAVENVFINRLISLAGTAQMPQVRAIASHSLEELSKRLFTNHAKLPMADAAHYKLLARNIKHFLEQPVTPQTLPDVLSSPPGAPIGQPAMKWLQIEPACSHWEWDY